MKAYSDDLRQRVIAAVDDGMPRDDVARLFQIAVPTIKRWLKRRRETGSLAVLPRPGAPSVKMAALRTGLLPQLEAHPDATLEEHCRRWEQAHGMVVSPSTISRVITHDLGWTRKKSR
jgi:transposase